MDKVLPSLDECEPVHGDLDTVIYLTNVHKVWEPTHYVVVVYYISFTLLPPVILFLLLQ